MRTYSQHIAACNARVEGAIPASPNHSPTNLVFLFSQLLSHPFTQDLEAYSGSGKRLRGTLLLGQAASNATLPISLWQRQQKGGEAEEAAGPKHEAAGAVPLVFEGTATCTGCSAEALVHQGVVELEVAEGGGRLRIPVVKREPAVKVSNCGERRNQGKGKREEKRAPEGGIWGGLVG